MTLTEDYYPVEREELIKETQDTTNDDLNSY